VGLEPPPPPPPVEVIVENIEGFPDVPSFADVTPPLSELVAPFPPPPTVIV
jgi:hypothetical protein